MSLIDDAKAAAKLLRLELEKSGHDIPYGKALDLIANQANFKNWSTYSAVLSRRDAAILSPNGPEHTSDRKQALPVESNRQPISHSDSISEKQMPAFATALSLLPVQFEAIHDFLVFLLFSGCRVTEIIKLKRSDIDLTGRGFFINGMGSARRFPLNHELFRVVRRLNNKTGYLFVDASGKNLMLQPQRSRDIFRKYANYELNLNALRNTFIDTAVQLSPPMTDSLLSGTYTVVNGFKLKQERVDDECLLRASNLVTADILRQAQKQSFTEDPVCI